ncbi:cubilin homolog [Branchiostoma floridae x Branchiostoma belcheri]
MMAICLVLATLLVRESQCIDAEERALRSMERYMNIPPVPNTRLKLHRMSSFQVNHHFQCSQLCYLTPGCQSYNYRKADGICELNNSTRDDSVFFTKTEEGWDHYERYSALISRSLWYECYHTNPCVKGSICVRKLLMGREPERSPRAPLCVCREGFSGEYCENGRSKYPLMKRKVACDAVHYGSSGSIWSPNYPMAYSNGSWCDSNVTVAEGHVVEFTFDPVFQLEHQRHCLYDYVQLSENGTEANLGRYCGDNHPEGPIRSSGQEITIEFRSDDTIVGSGFLVSWRTVLKDACTTKHTGTDLQYKWDLPPLTGPPFTFEVQARTDAYVVTAPLNQAADGDNMYSIIFGGWGGAKSRIYRSGSNTELVSTPDILSATQYKAFWISWDSDGTIAVGRGGEADPFMRWVDPNPLPIGRVGYSTAYGSSGQWTFCPTVRHGACDTKNTAVSTQYHWDLPPLTRSPFMFEVKADKHVSLALSSQNKDVDIMYGIRLGQGSVREMCSIRRGSDDSTKQKYTHRS